MTNYVSTWITLLANWFTSIVSTIYNLVIIKSGNLSIKFGEIIVYFGIIYIVISFLLNANLSLSRSSVRERRLRSDKSRELDLAKQVAYRQDKKTLDEVGL